ncbi:hypothetical protein E2I00_005105 [Balaenoptera physalus]|uniref:Uncharacterized protein n=1 Tax=Balaenoptera physalus TaxID=9770 RepID=A0A643CK55_BALPH|nr:hypothetical protein E2I00_005105 [Balaenoptera physalus]
MFCKFFKLLIYSLQTKCSAVSEEVTETGTEEATEKPRKKKKKKKDPEPYEVEGGTTELADFADVTMKEETDLQINNNVSGLWEEEPKKKKKKKKKKHQDPVFQGSDSSGYQSDHKKKKKKRKHSEEAEFTPPLLEQAPLLEHAPKKKREK